MYERILLATDGSDAAQPAIEHAIDLAAFCDATLSALYVVDASAAAAVPEAQAFTITDLLEDAGDQALDVVQALAEERDVTIDPHVRHGRAHREILTAADELDADLIVLGTHGRSGIDRVLLGSVAARVVRQSEIPVLIKRAPQT